MTSLPIDCKTVLVIEDDASIRETLQEALEGEGYTVRTAANGREGLDSMRAQPSRPCLVLVDMMMPVMTGREFLDEVLKDSDLATTPVFVVSAIADRGNTAGAAGFIRKPADLNVVLSMVEKHCHRH